MKIDFIPGEGELTKFTTMEQAAAIVNYYIDGDEDEAGYDALCELVTYINTAIDARDDRVWRKRREGSVSSGEPSMLRSRNTYKRMV